MLGGPIRASPARTCTERGVDRTRKPAIAGAWWASNRIERWLDLCFATRRRKIPDVKLVRNLHDSAVRLARLAEEARVRPLGGSIHPSELVARISGESDLACRPGRLGPVAPNRFAVRLNKADLAALGNPRHLTHELETITESMAMGGGRRLEGPVRVWLEADTSLDPGTVAVRSYHRAGRRPAWAFLTGDGPTLEMSVNRSLVGRGGDADVTILHSSVSTRHALIWFEGEDAWIRDLGSANGTFVDGNPVSGSARVPPEGMLRFGTVEYMLRVG